jgi:erp22-like protein
MSDKQKTAFLVAAAMAILHNGKRYEQNDVIELTEEEADKLEIYIKPAETNIEQRSQAEQTASDELTAAEQVESDAEEAAAETAAEEEELGEEAGETTKSNKGKNK